MPRLWLLLLPATAALAVGLAAVLPWGAALVVSVVLATAVGAAVARRETGRVLAIADRVNRWLGPEGHRPLDLGEARPWRQLAVALNALGASHDRRALRLQLERPWRRHLVDSIVGPALLFSHDERLLAANEAASRLLGIPEPEEDLTLVQALGSAALAGAAREARAVGRPVQVDAEVGRTDLRATASLVGDEILLILTDLTEQRRVEELRRHFVVNASHELKTPATAIQTLTDALEIALDRNPARAPELVLRLREESDRLVRMVHDLLDLRRLEERGPLERGPVDVTALVREAVTEVLPRADERDLTVEVDLPERALVAGVEQDLRLVVKNLLTNAVQYNRDGGRVDVRLRPEDGSYELEVTDTGIGIPQQDLHRIFERFYRVDVARSREHGGTGLGLAIVRHAVQRHGGSIRVESLLGEGTTFRVRLPVEPRP